MLNSLLFFAIALIWGSTWYAIHLQLGVVSPIWSVAYRFTLAAIIMVIFCLCTKRSLSGFTYRQHAAMAVQGTLLFSLNYVLYYIGSQYFISGLVSVTFASIIIMNIINSRIFFKTPLSPAVLVGATIGLIGLGVVFNGEMQHFQTASTPILLGLSICLLATLMASWGNMASIRVQRMQLPFWESTTIALVYGAALVIIIGLISREPLSFDLSWSYVGSWLYLALIGTILAFGLYLKLLSEMGPNRAAYVFVLIPIISLVISTHFEAFEWHWITLMGITLVLIGNVIILCCRKK